MKAMKINCVSLACVQACLFVATPARIVSAADTYSLALSTGSNQYARIANNEGITDGPITMEGWFKTGILPATQGYNLLTHGDSSVNVDVRITYNSDGTLHFLRSRDGIAAQNESYPSNLGDHAWHHVAITYDGASVRGYVDGVLVVGPFSSSGNGASGGVDEFAVGQYIENIPPMPGYDGEVDDVRVWNYARSQDQIRSFKDEELAGNEPGLVAYYKFENNLVDSTINGYDLTGFNSPSFSEDAAIVDPVQLVQALVTNVADLNLQVGIENSLDAKLNAALNALNDANQANDVAAINSLNAFITATQAQTGKQLTQQQADALITAARNIINRITP